MEKILLFLFMAFGSTIVYCQSLKPDVISTAGSFYANNNNSVSWTIGECIPETFSNSGIKLTQGFHQGTYEINNAIDYTENGMKINLFPNPATDFISLEMQVSDLKGYFYQLFDSNGKCLKNDKITSDRSQINLMGFACTTYLLNVFTPEQKLIKSFKIIKTN